MAESVIRRPSLLNIDSSAEKSVCTIKTNQNRIIRVPLILLFGFSVGVTDTPLRLRFREYPNDGVDATAISPVMVEPQNTDSPRYAANVQSTPPSGTEGPLRYDHWFFPQATIEDAWAHPQTHEPLLKLAPGKFYHVTAIHLTHSGNFDIQVEILASD